MHYWTLLIVLALAATSALAQAPLAGELDDVLREAGQRRREYLDTFTSLTAVETRLTEILDRTGKVEKQRTVVSDFLVYRSDSNAESAVEYRIAREVDGKAVRNSTEDGIKLFQRLAKAKTLQQQYEQLRDANGKYALKYAMWGMTLTPILALRPEHVSVFDFALMGRERLTGQDVTLLRYESKESRPVDDPVPQIRRLRKPRTATRGTTWLDSSRRVLRHENELMVSAENLAAPVAFIRYEAEYEASPYGITTPRRIVVLFYRTNDDKKAAEPMRLDARMTFTYDAFKRFEVTTTTDIQLPAPADH